MIDLNIKREILNTDLSINAIVMYTFIKEVIVLEHALMEIDLDNLNKHEKRKYQVEIKTSTLQKLLKMKSHITIGKVRKELIDAQYIKMNNKGAIVKYYLA